MYGHSLKSLTHTYNNDLVSEHLKKGVKWCSNWAPFSWRNYKIHYVHCDR